MFNLLRIEAINFDQSITDTNQLSVMRGGGLAMREAISILWECLDQTLNGNDTAEITKVSIGGSIGIFIFDDALPESRVLEETLIAALAGGTPGRPSQDLGRLGDFAEKFGSTSVGSLCAILSFAIAIEAIDSRKSDVDEIEYDCFIAANERALQSIRLSQLKQPNVVINEAASDLVCPWDGRRPATHRIGTAVSATNELIVSQPVAARFDFGRHAKRDSAPARFYSREIEKGCRGPDDQEFARLKAKFDSVLRSEAHQGGRRKPALPNDFSDLVADWGSEQTRRKLAVIYADGNKFSSIMRKNVSSLADYQSWDEMLQRERGRLLLEFVLWLSGKRPQDGPIPIEMLLWGGDEVMFVIPAELALEGISRFFQFNRHMAWAGQRLTHSLGIVICSYKTPIHRISDLARNLAEHVKGAIGDSPEQQIDAWQYAVLESVDTPTQLDQFFQRRYDEMHKSLTPLLVSDLDFSEQLEIAEKINNRIPRSQLYMIARELSGNPDSREAINRFETVAEAEAKSISGEISEILPTFGNSLSDEIDPWSFLHWAELLDYWPLEPSTSQSASQASAETRVAT